MTEPRTHQVTFADWSTRVIRSGSAEQTIVLLHSHGVDADMWAATIDCLPDTVSALTFDLRGQGHSTSAHRPFTLELLADDVIAVLGAENVRRCTLVGAAFGGTIAQLVATRAPELVERLVLLDTSATRTAESRQALLDRSDQAERGGLVEISQAALERWFPPSVRRPRPEVIDALRTAMERTDPVQYAAAGRAFANLELRANAASIGCPTLVAVGAEDIAMPVANSELLHQLIPGSELVVLAGLGHCPPAQDPLLVARLITEFGAPAPAPDPAVARLFDEGLRTRREVLGADYVDSSLAQADDFMMAFQRITTEWCWGYTWNRPGLDRRTRSLLNLVMLTALGKPTELRLHVLGALNNGVTVEEIREALVHATTYCGIPAGLDAFKAAHEVLVQQGVLDPA